MGLVAGLEEKDRLLLSGHGDFAPVEEGQVLIEEGQQQNDLYLVICGILHVHTDRDNKRILIARVTGGGGSLGKINIFDPDSASATATAKSLAQVWKATREDLESFITAYPEAGNRLLTALVAEMSRRIRHMNEKLVKVEAEAAYQSFWGQSIKSSIFVTLVHSCPDHDAPAVNDRRARCGPSERPGGAPCLSGPGHRSCRGGLPPAGPFLAKAKNRHADVSSYFQHGTPAGVWVHALTAHSLIHAGAVWWITGSAVLASIELVLHWLIDYAKCEAWTRFNTDQTLHYVCKVIYAMLTYPGVTWI